MDIANSKEKWLTFSKSSEKKSGLIDTVFCKKCGLDLPPAL